METKMKGKSKRGKAIIGIAMAAIMLALVFAAMVPTGSARTAATTIVSGDTVYIGEQGLNFPVGVTALEGVTDTPTEGASPITVTAGMTIPETIEGKYFADTDGTPGWSAGDFYVFIDHAEISGDIILNNAAQDTIVGKSVPKSSEIVFKVEPNIGTQIPGALIDIKVYDPDGLAVPTIDSQALNDVGILGTTMFVGNPAPTLTAPAYVAPAHGLRITDLDTGEYTVKYKLDKTTCNMLAVSSSEYKFTVRSEELSIEAVEDEVGKGTDMSVKINGNPTTYYYVTVTGVDVTAPPAIKMVGDVKNLDATGVAYPTTATPNLAAWAKTGSDGIAEVKIATTGADDRTYTIHVYETTFVTPPPATTWASDAAVAASGLTVDDDDVDIR
ncbi:MAG: hypothetical protein J7K81_01785, partial [Methanophagales archaeon]|nr:hypothetical protein [Methanophagales archaeon]